MGQRSVFTIGIIYPHQQSPAVLENFHIQYSINLQVYTFGMSSHEAMFI